MKENDVTGCLLADKHGLCLAVAGKARPDCTGIVTAIAKQVAKLEPSSTPPIVLLEADNRKCLIQQSPTLTAAIFKKTL
ncbi:ragulator complex protein LAMTOR5 homolog isoform X2 [Homalodisca vitripennis]|nr:ragulator complex protein LAMTOR5 homolog isoform X2 [Homalodisca vitripennis]